jgi:hypothetical protein
VRITVSLETHAVITQPSPARVKGGSFVPLEVSFTRGSQTVMLPEGSSIEFVLKPKNQFTGGTLVYHPDFSVAAGALYVGIASFAAPALMAALGLSDDAPANDIAQVEGGAEVAWSIAGQRFRSATFSITVEAPLIDSGAVALPPELAYPTPAELQALFDAKADRAPANANYRFKNGALLQLFNETTGKWHTLFLTGADGATQLAWSQNGES